MDRDREEDSLYEGMHDQDFSDECEALRSGDMVYMVDSEYGARVVDWGPPNSQYLRQESPNPPYVVDCWKISSVQFWHRYPYRCRWYDGERWSFAGYFWCKDWQQIPILFDKYWATAGFYTRVSFCVEAYEWTWEEGLMYEDHV